jgi:SulP family sulfate permease
LSFRPKLLDSLKGYDRAKFLSDLIAGITVGVIALPLAIGFAIASGVNPAQGIWTAIIAGFLISALGGTKVQIGGPTGAFVPILAGIVATHGYAGLALATVMAGVMLLAMGVLKLGNLIKFIPYPVTAGFTSGIAVIIFVGQIKEFLGLKIAMPHHTHEQVFAIVQNLREAHWQTLALGLLACAIIMFSGRKNGTAFRRRSSPSRCRRCSWRSSVSHVETIGSKFGASRAASRDQHPGISL